MIVGVVFTHLSSLSILNDAKFGLVDLNVTRFPDTAGQGIQVHSGFQETFERTADGLLDGVLKGLASTGAKKVVVTGHSLGAPELFAPHSPTHLTALQAPLLRP
jgi:hypothetical protein